MKTLPERRRVQLLSAGVTLVAALVGLGLQRNFPFGTISLSAAQPGIALEGFSGLEPFGRWTDGDVARVRFAQPLPRHFTLRFRGHAYAGNPDKSVDIHVGGVRRASVTLTPFDADYSVDLESAWLANDVEFMIHNAQSPKAIGESADGRRLGVAFSYIEVVP
jgi:hypothetical protein